MGSLERPRLDLECGVGCSSSAVSNDGKGESICVSKATEGSCSSQYYSASDISNQGHDSGSEIDQVAHSRRVSSVVATDCVVDIDQNSVDEVRISVEIVERDCRICMLSLDSESGSAIELGCSCKNELAAVHQHCAETWFTSKGNRICEICKSVTHNVVVPNNSISRQRILEVNRSSTSVSGRNAPSTNAASFQGIEVTTVSRSSDLSLASSFSVCERVCILCACWLIWFSIVITIGSIVIVIILRLRQ